MTLRATDQGVAEPRRSMSAQAELRQVDRLPNVGERRWPMALAVIVAITLTSLVPPSLRHGPTWLLPAIEALLLGALIIGDPGRIDRRSNVLRGLSIGLVSVLLLTSLSFTVQLVFDLINGG